MRTAAKSVRSHKKEKQIAICLSFLFIDGESAMLTPDMFCTAQRWSSSYEDHPDDNDGKDDSGDVDVGDYSGDDDIAKLMQVM